MNEKVLRHKEICDGLNELYARKNHDYGDSFHTLLDLANYAIMTVLEMDTPDESHAILYAYDKPIYTVGEDK